MLSKRSAYIAITVLAALSVEIGCGDGSHKTSQRKTIPAKGPQNQMVTRQKMDANGQPMFDKNGKAIMETVSVNKAGANANTGSGANNSQVQIGPDGKPIIKDLNVPKSDPNLDAIEKSEKDLTAGAPVVTREDLAAGNYELKSIATSVRIDAGRVNEVARAIQWNTFVPGENGRGFQLQSMNNSNSAGMITNFNELIDKRKVDIPVSFKVDKANGPWTPNREQSANLSFTTFVSTQNGKAVLNDGLDVADSTNPVSILGMIASAQLQQDKSYRATDAKGVVMYLRLMQKSSSQLVVHMVFEEQRSEKDPLTMDRNIFFNFNVTPDSSAKAAGGAAPVADDKIDVKSSATGDTLQ